MWQSLKFCFVTIKLELILPKITSKKLASKSGKKHICSIQHDREKFMLKALSFEKCDNSIFAIPSTEFSHSLLFQKKWINGTFFNCTQRKISWIGVLWRRFFFSLPTHKQLPFYFSTMFWFVLMCVYNMFRDDMSYSS